MAIVQRRVFFGKVGAADQLVKHIQEGKASFQKYGVNLKSRILTDYQSGRTDRVAMEWEVDSLGDIDAAESRAMASSEAQAYFGAWMGKLNSLIDYAEVENWSVR